MRKTILLACASLLLSFVGAVNLQAQSWSSANDGIYLLYNFTAGKFVNRAGSWGTQAVMRAYGSPVKVATDGDGITTFTFRDLKQTLFADKAETGTWLYCDNTRNNTFAIEEVSGETGVYYIKNIMADSYLADDGSGNLVTTADATQKWKLIRGNDVEAIYTAKKLAMLKNVVNTAGFDADKVSSEEDLTGTTGLKLEQVDVTSQAGFDKVSRNEKYQPSVQNPGYTDLLTLKLNAPAAGLYKIQFAAMYRISSSTVAIENANAGADYANVFMKAGDYEYPIATATSEATETNIHENSSNGVINGVTKYFPNGQDGFGAWANAGHYINTVYAYASAAGTIEVVLRCEMGNTGNNSQWCVWNPTNAKMYQLVDLTKAKAALNALITEAKDIDLENTAHEAALNKPLTDAIDDAETAVVGSSLDDITAAKTALSAALGNMKASIEAYARVQAALDNGDAKVAFYDEAAQYVYYDIAGPIKTQHDDGTIETAYCDANITDINNAVDAAAKACVQPKDGADLTARITNNSFETGDFTGWTNSGLGVQGNDAFQKAGNKYAEFWHNVGAKSLQQTVSGLPQGLYKVTVLAKANAVEYGKLFANEDCKQMTIADETNEYSVETPIITDGEDLTFGVKSFGTYTGWFAVDNFRLTYVRELTTDEIAAETTDNKNATTDDIAAYNAAIAALPTYGFDEGEAAPYMNAATIHQLVDLKIADPENTKAKYVKENTIAINALTWTLNTEEVNAVYNGDFALTPADAAPAGWITTHNAGLGGEKHARTMVDDRLKNFNSTKSAFYMRMDGTNSDQGTIYRYNGNKDEAYMMPLKAGVIYTLDFDFGGWGQQRNCRFFVKDAGDNNVGTIDKQPSGQVNNDNTKIDHISLTFTPKVDGNCVINVQNPGANANNALVASNFVIKKLPETEVEMTIVDGVNYSTFIAPFDVTLPTGVTAKQIAYNKETGKLEYTDLAKEGETLNANTPVLLYSASAVSEKFSKQAVITEKTYTVSNLTGCLEKTAAPTGCYLLQKQNGTLGWYQVAEGSDLYCGAYRAYLTLPTSAPQFIALDGEATAISGVKAESSAKNGEAYDLTGRRVNVQSKGLYIINGKKIVK